MDDDSAGAPVAQRGPLRWAILGAGGMAALFLAFGVRATWQLVQGAGWSGDRLDALPLMVALGVAGYLFRFLRWHVLVRRVAPRLRLRASLRISMAGFAMGLTPGRVGEFFKFSLLREETGIPEAESSLVFPLERATEATSFAALAIGGAVASRVPLTKLGPGALAATVAIPLTAIVALSLWRRVARPSSGTGIVSQLVRGVRLIAHPGTLATALVLALLGRCYDTLLFWVAASVVGLALPLPGAALAWGLAGLAGGLLLTPAGVGAVEGSLVATVVLLNGNAQSALLAAVLARCLTLWVWVPMGLWLVIRATTRPRAATVRPREEL